MTGYYYCHVGGKLYAKKNKVVKGRLFELLSIEVGKGLAGGVH